MFVLILLISAHPGLMTRTQEYWPLDTAGYRFLNKLGPQLRPFENFNPSTTTKIGRVFEFYVCCSEEERSSGSDSGIFQGKISPHRLNLHSILNHPSNSQTNRCRYSKISPHGPVYQTIPNQTQDYSEISLQMLE